VARRRVISFLRRLRDALSLAVGTKAPHRLAPHALPPLASRACKREDRRRENRRCDLLVDHSQCKR
jgi:hypothetical protein